MITADYGICARRITVTDGVPNVQLIRCTTVTDLADVPALITEYLAQYGAEKNVLIELDTTV